MSTRNQLWLVANLTAAVLGACAGSPANASAPASVSVSGPAPSVEAGDVPPPVFVREAESAPAEARERCQGTMTADLLAELMHRGQATRGCYESALRKEPTLGGRMQIAIRVGVDGQVVSAGVVSDTIGSKSLKDCVLKVARGPFREAPQGGCVDVSMPINFQPKQTDAGVADGG
jgi:hypothetical protein